MTLLNGITHLTNWMGNVIMPTLSGLFFALSVVRYARGYPHQYIAWAGLMCLMVSGLLRGLETFASQSAWNNPDTIWITLRGLVNWICNVFMPVYAVLQIVQGVLAYGGVGQRRWNRRCSRDRPDREVARRPADCLSLPAAAASGSAGYQSQPPDQPRECR
jgi:hypothetical protein